jgi:major membrane immunogen (membrane-anchored lipoprotein)
MAEKELKAPKPNKKGFIKTVLTAIPTAIKQYKKKKSKFKTDEKKFVKQEKDKVSTLTTQANKTYNDLTDKSKKDF